MNRFCSGVFTLLSVSNDRYSITSLINLYGLGVGGLGKESNSSGLRGRGGGGRRVWGCVMYGSIDVCIYIGQGRCAR